MSAATAIVKRYWENKNVPSTWKNQVLVIKKASNENVKTKEKWKNVSYNKVSLIKWLIFGVLKNKNINNFIKETFYQKHCSTFSWF